MARAALSCLGLQLALAAAPVQAQNDAALGPTAGGLRITPTLDISTQVVNNSLSETPDYGYYRAGDIVTQIRPGLQMTGRLGRSSGALYYGLDLRRHSRALPGQAASDNARNALNASLSSELLERLLYVDAAASITQQTLSAYGRQSVDNTTFNPNRAEVSQLSLRPYTRGTVSDIASYDLSLSADAVHVRGAASPDSRGTGAALTLSSPSSGALLGWGAQLSKQHSTFSGGQATDSSRYSLSLKFRPDVDLAGALRVGQEATTITGVYDATYTNYGGEVRWTPSSRTSVLLSADQRYFGRAFQVTAEHRLQRTSFRFTSIRDVSTSANAAGVGAPVTLYQLFYNLYASIQPDPVLREQQVRDLLRLNGLDPNAVASGGFVNGGASLQRREDFGLTYTGLRTTFTLQGYGSTISRLDTPGSLSGGGIAVRQYGAASSAIYRLSPDRNVTLGINWLRTLSSGTQVGNQLRSTTLAWSERLGRHATASVTARYSLFDGTTNPYHETSLGASLSLRF